MKKLGAFIFCLLFSCAAQAQQPIIQSGFATPGHALYFLTNGVAADAGTAAQGFLTSIGVTAQGPGICQNSAPITQSYNQICLVANSTGNAGISFFNHGTTAAFTISVNGVVYQFPFTGSGTIGPPSTTVNDFACWNNTVGTLLSDCKLGPPSTVIGDVACWNNTVGTLLSDCGGAASTIDAGGATALTNGGATNNVLINAAGKVGSKPLGGTGGLFDTICSSTIGQAWVRLTGGWGCLALGYANPIWWGADPTGGTDSYTAVGSALSSGMPVVFSNGLYKNATGHWTIPAGGSVSGVSESGAIINSTLTSDDVFQCTGGTNNTTVHDLTIRGPAYTAGGTVPTSGWGINCSGGSNDEHFDRIYIEGTYDGLYVGGTNSTVIGNRLESIMGDDSILALGGGGQIAYNQLDNNVIFNSISGTATYEAYPGGSQSVAINTTTTCNGYYFVTTTGGTTGAGSTTCNNAGLVPTAMYTAIPDPHGGSTVWECIGSAAHKGVEVGPSEWVLYNDITGPDAVGVVLNSANGANTETVVGNNIAGQLLFGIEFAGGGVAGSYVEGNQFEFIGRSGGTGYPIYDGTAGGDIYNRVVGNGFKNCVDACIVVQGSTWLITGNIINGADTVTTGLGAIATSGNLTGTTINSNVIASSGKAIEMTSGSSSTRTTIVGNTVFGSTITTVGTTVVNASNN